MQSLGVPGDNFVDKTNLIVGKTFHNDQNYRSGTLYDWDMNVLEENVEFKFEKHRNYTTEGYEVDYYVHFMPNYNPEYLYKSAYYKDDGKERLGFYIEVLDRSKDKYELWLITGKDDRVAMDRYLALKCNWCLEWMDGKNLCSKICVVRENIEDNIREWETTQAMKGSNISGKISVILPSSKDVLSLDFGKRLMVSDNEKIPRCFEISDMKDASPLGVTKLYLSRVKFNAHSDYYGKIDSKNIGHFTFNEVPDDLPEGYGNEYHCICDCMESSFAFEPEEPVSVKPMLSCSVDQIRVNGTKVHVHCSSEIPSENWHYFVDNEEYSIEDLMDYFEFAQTSEGLEIKAINKVMVKYILKVSVYDEKKSYYSSIELEVKA